MKTLADSGAATKNPSRPEKASYVLKGQFCGGISGEPVFLRSAIESVVMRREIYFIFDLIDGDQDMMKRKENMSFKAIYEGDV